MRLEPGCSVHCAGAVLGELADVVVDPRSRRVTHVVVRPHDAFGAARIAPIELVEPGDGDVLVLRGTPDGFAQLPEVSGLAYLGPGEVPVDDPEWEVGISTILSMPTSTSAGLDAEMPFDDHVELAYDRVPRGTVELAHNSAVVDSAGRRLGRVDGFTLSDDGAITHLVLEHGHLWRRRGVTVPVGAIETVGNGVVTLTLDKDELLRLPPG
jgi:sporulation protein YlmC with PRC-barrel domain